IEAVTEVIDAKLRYPETALLLVQFDAKQFQSIPVISCEPDGRIIRIPSNYDPDLRTYSGTWDGTFKWAFTNNPAWIYYDIQISERFGLGTRIKAENLSLSKWVLYQIAQYCDQLVPDGRGGSGTEPRFLCDVYIQSQEEAWTVINDLAAIFRGATFWANNQMNVIADMPRDIDYIVTRANVKDGKFTYSNASEKTHYSTAMVAWSDPANAYQDAVEAVSDNKLVKRYGIKQADVTAIGCVRQTEAIRRGKWILHTNDADRAISYTMGLDGDIPVPGSIVGVADALLAGRPLGGRISAVNGRNITLDRVSSAAVGERLIVNLPSGKAQGRTIEAVNEKIITVTTEYSETPIPESVWAVDATDLALQLYRIIGVANGDDSVSFDITGIQYDPDKWAKIDTGARIESRPISVIPPGVQSPPTNVQIGSYNAVDQGINITTLRVTWERADSAIAYEAQWRRDNGNWITVPHTSALGFEISGIYAGKYQARVRAINAAEISSIWANADETTLNGKEGNPPALASFTTTPLVFGIQLDWNFPAGTDDTLKTEIQYSQTSDGQNALLLSDVAYPARSYQQMGLSVGQEFYYRARIVDKSSNQGPWTDWIYGVSSTDTKELTDHIFDEIKETDAWKSLVGDVGTQSDLLAALKEQSEALARGVLENALNVTETRKQLNDAVESIRTNITNTRTELEAADAYLTQRVDGYIAENDGRVAQVINDVTTVKNEQEVQAQELDAVVAKADGNAALIASETTARISGDEANAKEIATTKATVADNTGRITSVEQAQVTTDGAIASIKQDITAQSGAISDASAAANTAQQAADAAATAAGNKGKVIYGSTAPAAADRQTQNLWIDTTGNANT
ncbi:phage tail protein, partial [Brenneria populi subsp. brevivirga]|uniref:host specificity protein J n=1 Tax=Brenneria populi TaxID=1505588 RepID=UPI002E1928E3|nr:phage tail protein [Brenneria populi subsp. brevivirga]